MANRYWVGGSGQWLSTSHWSTSDGGASGASVPGAGDTAYFTGSSRSSIGTVFSENMVKITGGTSVSVGTLNIASDANFRTCIMSNSPGSSATISADTVVLADCDFMDIIATGAATWSGTGLGDAGGNTGITFDAPKSRYWVGDIGEWHISDTSHWATTSGGSGGASIPLPQDTAIFDANSFSTAGLYVSAWFDSDVSFVPAMDWSAVTNNPTITFGFQSATNAERYFVGNMNLGSGVTLGSNVNPGGTSSYTVVARAGDVQINPDSNEALLLNSSYLYFVGAGGEIDSVSNIDMRGYNGVVLQKGVFNSMDFGYATWSFRIESGATLNLAGSQWSVENGVGTTGGSYQQAWYNAGTVISSGGTIILGFGSGPHNSSNTTTFSGGGGNYGNILLDSSEGVPNHTFQIQGDNIFDSLALDVPGDDSPSTIEFQAGSHTVVTGSFSAGATISHTTTITSSSNGIEAFLQVGGGTDVSYVNVRDNHGLGEILFDASLGGVNTGNNTNWYFGGEDIPGGLSQDVDVVDGETYILQFDDNFEGDAFLAFKVFYGEQQLYNSD